MKNSSHNYRKSQPIKSKEDAEELAIEALYFIAQDQKRLERFLSITGIVPETIRQAAQSHEFLAGTLNFFLNFEPALMEFCHASGRPPESVQQALAKLPGGDVLESS